LRVQLFCVWLSDAVSYVLAYVLPGIIRCPLSGRLRFIEDSSWDGMLAAYFGPTALAGDQPAADAYDVPPTLSVIVPESNTGLLPMIRR